MALLYTGQQWAVVLTILAVGIALKAALVVWLHRDVRRAGRPVWPWTVAGIVAFIPTAIVWRVKRPRPAAPPPRPRPMVADTPEAPAGHDPFRVGLRGPVVDEAPEPDAVRAALARPSEAGAAEAPRRVSCPRCTTVFAAVPREDDPGRVTCPSCGVTGRV